ncbi:MAG: hypothetical protein ACR2RF_05905 [Geminicoccaceae bacterium]
MEDEPGEPTWMYRLHYGKVQSRIFDSNAIPNGWVDSPVKCVEEKPSEAKPKQRRSKKVKDGDDSTAGLQVSPPEDPGRD